MERKTKLKATPLPAGKPRRLKTRASPVSVLPNEPGMGNKKVMTVKVDIKIISRKEIVKPRK